MENSQGSMLSCNSEKANFDMKICLIAIGHTVGEFAWKLFPKLPSGGGQEIYQSKFVQFSAWYKSQWTRQSSLDQKYLTNVCPMGVKITCMVFFCLLTGERWNCRYWNWKLDNISLTLLVNFKSIKKLLLSKIAKITQTEK